MSRGTRAQIETIASWLANICSNQANNNCPSRELEGSERMIESTDNFHCCFRRMESFSEQIVTIISTCTAFATM